MSLVIAVNGVYESYFKNPRGNLNPEGTFHVLEPENPALAAYQNSQKKEQKKRMNLYAEEIMSKDIHHVLPSASINEAMKIMSHFKIHHLLIMEEDTVKGIISDRDILRNIDKLEDKKNKVSDIMQESVLLCLRETEIRMIAQIMLQERISCAPVINSDHIVQGVVTRSDLLRCIVNNMPIDAWV